MQGNTSKITIENKTLKKEKKKRKIILIILIFLIILAGGTWFFLYRGASQYDGHAYDDPIKKGGGWTTGQLVMPGFGEVPMKSADNNLKITLGNSKINEAYFKYKVEVKQKDKYVTIEDSKLIKPGNAITSVSAKKLSKTKGKYPMKITVNTFSLKDKTAPLNGSVVDATLVIN